jgi:hypothetical protein
MARATVEDLSPETEDILALDRRTLDPSKHYRFVQDRRQNVARKISQGYEVVLMSVHKVRLQADTLLKETSGGADDQIRVGDTILMQCDKSLHLKRRKGKRDLAEARLGTSDQAFKDGAQKRGVRFVTGDEGDSE